MRCIRLRATTGALLLALGLAAAPACQYNPATGERQFNLISLQNEIALGAEAMTQLEGQYGGEVQNTAIRQYVSDVGESIAQHVEHTDEVDYRELPWEFTLLDSDVINAFALPGGKVFITVGLASRLNSEAQLAAVLGHEIGHVTARHGGQRISAAMGIQLGTELAARAAGAADSQLIQEAVPLVVGAGGQGYLLKYSREQELEADDLGMRYMSRAGYDPRGMLEVMHVLKAASGGASQPEFLSTHPLPDTRIRKAEERLRGRYSYTIDNPQYRSYEGRYQEQFLGRLRAAADVGRELAMRAWGSAPASWCAHCSAGS